MIKNVHLGFFINEYNKDPIWTDLIEFESVDELDRFMDYFYNNNENVRELFNEEISEYAIDNIGQFKKVEEISNKKFRGRLAAYYYDRTGRMNFLELPTKDKKPVRNYKRIDDLKACVNFLWKLFDETISKIDKRYGNSRYGPTKGEFVHYICEKFNQVGYEFSDEELYYLVKYYNNRSPKNKEDCLILIRTNVKRYFIKRYGKDNYRNREGRRK